jgi:hypothetical protein
VRLAVEQSAITDGDGGEHAIPVSEGPVRNVGTKLAGGPKHSASPAQPAVVGRPGDHARLKGQGG